MGLLTIFPVCRPPLRQEAFRTMFPHHQDAAARVDAGADSLSPRCVRSFVHMMPDAQDELILVEFVGKRLIALPSHRNILHDHAVRVQLGWRCV